MPTADKAITFTVTAPGSDDWVQRSTAPGVFMANQLDNAANIAAMTHKDASQVYMSLDTTIKPAVAAAGSCRFQILNIDYTSSGQLSVPFGTTRGPGVTTYIQFLVRFEPDDCYAPYPPQVYNEATKLCLVSRDSNGASSTGSNQLNEVVLQLNHNAGELAGYNRTLGGDYTGWEEVFSSACPNSTLKTRYAFNRGVSPLSGTNPDTGAAWTACEQVAAQYGLIYGRYSGGTAAPDVRPGYGDPFSGGFRLNPREWMCFELRIIINQFGQSAGNRITVWGAVQGQAPTLLFDLPDISVGLADPTTYYNCLNLLPYTTNRVEGGRKVTSRTNAIPGIEIWNVGTQTPIGNGQLEYDATTGRVRFAAAGQAFGVARGFSAANNILVRNVISATEFYSFLQVKATPALLPASNQTETVTIANGRPDTQRHYARVIASANPINFPGGFAPVLP